MVDSFIAFIFAHYGFLGLIGFLLAFIIFRDPKTLWARIRAVAKLIVGSQAIDTFDTLIAKLKYYTDFKVENMYMKDPGRREIFKDVLHLRFTVFAGHLHDLHRQDFKNMQGGEMYGMLVGCIHDSIEEWSKRCTEVGIPQVVVEKYNKFSNKNIEFMLKAIEMVCYSNVYGDNMKRMQAVYSLYTAMFEISMAEAERSLNDINGELDGVEYKGYVCCG